MTCSTCGKQYVGETSQTLNKRFRTHESVIRINSENNIAEHFNSPNHSPISYTVKVVGQEEDKNRRLRLEESWIHLLNTFQPRWPQSQIIKTIEYPTRTSPKITKILPSTD